MKKFKDKYRIPSTRLQNWDYSWQGNYFVTICVKDHNHYFGKIINGVMQLNELGLVAYNEWLKTPDIRPDMNIQLGEFVVMPDHFHGILIIGENKYNTRRGMVSLHGIEMPFDIDELHGSDDQRGRDAMHGVSTVNIPGPKNKFGPQSKNLGSIIRGFKSAVTTYARKKNIVFQWQDRFHDHKIRSSVDFMRISEYIKNNPVNFHRKKFRK